MISNIIKYGSDILRRKAEDISTEDDPVKIVEDLFSTLKRKNGLGLAAPQIGISKRIFVCDTTSLCRDNQEIPVIEKEVINPIINWFSKETTIFQEGCLSIPDIYEEVKRPERIRVIYYDKYFNRIEEELDGVSARIFQHEYDHLNVILFIDKINPFRRRLLSVKLKKIRK
jgi:peptide deformylase